MWKRFVGVALLMATTAWGIQAQGWSTADDGLSFNCGALPAVQVALEAGDFNADALSEPFVRLGSQEYSTFEYIGLLTVMALSEEREITTADILNRPTEACENAPASGSISGAPTGNTFTVVVNSGANLRSCASTTCSIVSRAAAGDVLTAVGVEGEWYIVEVNGQTAYIADFLVTRGPDAILDTDSVYTDPITGCIVAFDVKRGDSDMRLILSGDGRGDVVADLYRPNESSPLKVQGQLDKTFIDTGDPYILQYYSWNIGWPLGTYQLSIDYNGGVSRLAWEMTERGDYSIYILCD